MFTGKEVADAHGAKIMISAEEFKRLLTVSCNAFQVMPAEHPQSSPSTGPLWEAEAHRRPVCRTWKARHHPLQQCKVTSEVKWSIVSLERRRDGRAWAGLLQRLLRDTAVGDSCGGGRQRGTQGWQGTPRPFTLVPRRPALRDSENSSSCTYDPFAWPQRVLEKRAKLL